MCIRDRTCSTRILLQLSYWKNTLSIEEYEKFFAKIQKRGCVTMMDWLREYNLADVVQFVEAVKKTRRQYYDDEIGISTLSASWVCRCDMC